MDSGLDVAEVDLSGSRPICVCTMSDRGHLDHVRSVINEVQDSIVTTTCGVSGFQGWPERLPNALRVVEQRPGYELVHRLRDFLREYVR